MMQHSIKRMLARKVMRPYGWLVVMLLVPQMATAAPIVIGSIHHDPVSEIRKFWPLAVYLGQHLQAEGIDQGKVVVANSIQQMATFLQEGKVDLYIDSPFAAVAVSHLAESKFLLRRWKKGIAEYYTVIFTSQDGGIQRLEELKGKVIAFDDPSSSSGYMLPKMALTQAGYSLVSVRDAAEPVPPDAMGYVFSGADENTMTWVLRGKVMAGAMDNQSYIREVRANRDRLRIIYESFAIPRHIVSYRNDLSPTLVQRIAQVLQAMTQSEAGRQALQEFELTTKFDPLSAETTSFLSRIRSFVSAEDGASP